MIPAVLAIRYDWKNNSVVILHNFAKEPREITFRVGLAEASSGKLINLLSDNNSEADDAGRHRIVIEGYGYRWYRAGGLDYLLRRSEV